jgi:hypothetical protein
MIENADKIKKIQAFLPQNLCENLEVLPQIYGLIIVYDLSNQLNTQQPS